MSDPRPRLAACLVLCAASVFPALPAGAADAALHDPLRPPDYRAATKQPERTHFNADAWQLASTLVSSGRRVAIINGRTVRADDRVGGARVLRIEHGAVRLDYRGRQFTIRRGTPNVRYHERRGEQAE